MTLRFDDRVVLVTGAGAGLGAAYARWFGERGARVVVNNRLREGRASTAEAVAEAIRAAGGHAVADHHDVADPASGEGMVATALAAFGRIDVVIANAAVSEVKPVTEVTLDELRQGMDLNFFGSVAPMLAALPHMLAQDYGRIVATTSAAALFGQRGRAAYAASKMALTGFARCLAIDTHRQDIRVNTISPYARTRMSGHALPEAHAELMAPEQVAPVVGWLAHQDCGVTGQILGAGAGRVRRAAIVEGPIVSLNEAGMAGAWTAIEGLGPVREPRNSGHSAMELAPELKDA